jgi:hypothetical protein
MLFKFCDYTEGVLKIYNKFDALLAMQLFDYQQIKIRTKM